jgi:hypothetical protein
VDPTLLASIGTAGGVFVTFASVVIYLLRRDAVIGRQYRDDVARIETRNAEAAKAAAEAAAAQEKRHSDAIAAIETRHAAALEASDRRHAAATAALETKITALEETNKKVLDELDEERRRRWRAEDTAADARRGSTATPEGL